MRILREPVELSSLLAEIDAGFNDMLKIVVDIQRKVLAVDAEMHSDLESILLDDGSKQSFLWGANIYPDKKGQDFIEYTSFINIRPSDKNKSMELLDVNLREKVLNIVNELIVK